MSRLSEEERSLRLGVVRLALSRQPGLTKSHFQKCHGYSYPFLEWCESQGVRFGKVNPRQAWDKSWSFGKAQSY